MLARRCRATAQVPRVVEHLNQEPPPPPPPEEVPPQSDPRMAAGSLFPTFGQLSRPRPVARPMSVARTPVPKNLGLAASFRHYLPIVADAVHSGSGRTAGNDDSTDYYPVPLSQATLRPGTIYADPYGHVLMIVKRVPQTDGAAAFLRRRRAARRDGRAEAFLARQFPLRARAGVRWPWVQALSANRDEGWWRLAAADKCRDRGRIHSSETSRSNSRGSEWKTSTTAWTM